MKNAANDEENKELPTDKNYVIENNIIRDVNSQYSSYDDLEKLFLHQNYNVKSKIFNKEEEKNQSLFHEAIIIKRIFIESTLVFLIITIVGFFGYNFVFKGNLSNINKIFMTKTNHFTCNIVFTLIIWIINISKLKII